MDKQHSLTNIKHNLKGSSKLCTEPCSASGSSLHLSALPCHCLLQEVPSCEASTMPLHKADALGLESQSFPILISCSGLLNPSLCKNQTHYFMWQLPFPRGYIKFPDLQITANTGFILNWDRLELRFPMSQKYFKSIMLKTKHCL